MTDLDVIMTWATGPTIEASSDSVRTDGVCLWSHDLLVGFVGEDHYKFVFNYTARPDRDWLGQVVPGKFVSRGVSRHVNLARRWGLAVTPPEEG